MNREIKFKIWYKDGKMTRPFTANQFYNRVPSNISDCGTLLQYTGLKDKNGKEIYEGDLLAEIDHINELEAWGKPIIVEWGEYKSEKDTFELSGGTVGFVVRYFDGSINGIHSMDDTYGFKSIDTIVLGNIYENPELLK